MSALRKADVKTANDTPAVQLRLEVSDRQAELLGSRADTICFRAGAGAGKTFGGVLWSMLKATTMPGSRGMIVAPTYPMMEQSILVHFVEVGRLLGLVDQFGNTAWKHNKSKREISFPNGSTIYLRSADNPERLLGADLAWVYGDEVALWQEKAYKYAVGRLRQQGFDLRQALFTFTPKGLNWAYKVFGKPTFGLHVIAAATRSNPWAPKSFRDRLKREYGKGTRFYQQEVLGEFVAYEGLVYPGFGPELVITDELDTYQFVEYACGVDWGWSNPGAMIVIGRTEDDVLIVVREVYEAGKGLEWWAAQANALSEEFNGLPFFCDPADPRAIEYLRGTGGVDAKKAANDVIPGIALVGGRFQNRRLLVHASCVRLGGELMTYSWKQKADGTIYTDQPEKINDHACDGTRYCVMGLDTQRRSWWQDERTVKELYGT